VVGSVFIVSAIESVDTSRSGKRLANQAATTANPNNVTIPLSPAKYSRSFGDSETVNALKRAQKY
jgi:hypothetical protein